jgi:hypothetical protein
LPDDKAARQALDALPLLPGDEVQHAPATFATKFDEIHVHAGQRRPRCVGNISQSSEPTSETASGIWRPFSRSASATPRAI